MKDLKIFDKNGKALHIGDVIGRLLDDALKEYGNKYDSFSIQKYKCGSVNIVGHRHIEYEPDDTETVVELNAL